VKALCRRRTLAKCRLAAFASALLAPMRMLSASSSRVCHKSYSGCFQRLTTAPTFVSLRLPPSLNSNHLVVGLDSDQ